MPASKRKSKHRNCNFKIDINVLVLGRLTSYLLSSRIIKSESWTHLNNLALADWTYNEPGIIYLLIGADVYNTLLLDGKIQGPDGSPFAQNTHLGWILSGSTESLNLNITSMHSY